MASEASRYLVDFPTLFVVPAWIQRHCVIPDGFRKGRPFKMYDWQLWVTLNHYQVKSTAKQEPGFGVDLDVIPIRSAAFTYRRSQVIAPQKALALDTPIATPTGWTSMGEVAVGDRVFDESGLPTRVLSKSQIWDAETFRVTFSDGASLVACGDHEWWVQRRTKSGRYVEDRVRTNDLVGNLTDAHGARVFRVPNALPLQTPAADLPIPPYTLGAWLGDGETNGSRVTGIDEGVFERIEADGFEIRQDMKITKRRCVIGIRRGLRAAGVFGNKHIPDAYLRASESQRWALLQGLMDTDGFADVRQGKCEFTTTLPSLRDGMLELLASLGVKPVCYAGEATLYGRVTGPKWRVSFAARSDMPVFGLVRKQSRLKSPGRAHAQFGHRRIVSVERVATVPTQCLTIDAESHVFLAGREMIPTCNTGKGPWAAAITAAEAVGPVLFLGWAKGGETYDCADHGCDCGWVYTYRVGEPMGHQWATPLIQLLATSEDQVDNVYKPLKGMARGERLRDRMKVREGFIRIAGEDDDPEACRIDVVTSSAKSRLGNPITFCIQDETQLYTAQNKLITVAETMRRGAAAMGGRSIETTNCYDPGENSVAQRTREGRARDVFRFYEPPPLPSGDDWKFTLKAQRRRIFTLNYKGSPHADLEGIIAEAEELVEKDPAQAERFFGNRLVQGLGTWLADGLWDSRGPSEGEPARAISDGTLVCLGFDGSDSDDCTGIRLRTIDGYHFTPTYGPDARPTFWDPAEWGGSIPRGEVNAAVDEICRRYKVKRAYCDPRDWQSEIGDWALKYGDDVFLEWATYRIKQMHEALERAVTDLKSGRTTLDGCPTTTLHVGNARKVAKPAERYILGKPHGAYHQKIDMAMADVLAHIAGEDALLDGWAVVQPTNYLYTA